LKARPNAEAWGGLSFLRATFTAAMLVSYEVRRVRLAARETAFMSRFDSDTDEAVVTESETRLKKPPLYQVVLHNDDFTTMEFVVYVLQNVFQRSETDALRIMLQVHLEGVGVAGVYTYEIAEMKVSKVTELARANEFPLLCTIEESAG
jgi:ATP-dependent Clp protease adaptor protein ClpS